MTPKPPTGCRVAIACGGTGGHLFPGIAIADELRRRDCAVTLLISPRDVDQQAVKSATGVGIEILPAVGLTRGGSVAFLRGFIRSYRGARKIFKAAVPDAVLAMGGFTSAPPVLAGKRLGAAVFLHESNSIPGRANRWLSWVIDRAFISFPDAARRLHTRKVATTGTPVRGEFVSADAAECRVALGLEPHRPVLFVTGGSQGASALNELIIDALPHLARSVPELQLLHLTGPKDSARVEQAGKNAGMTAVVRPFLQEMHLALGAATVAVSRAGASSLAELAAMRVPAILIPYPAATDNHQYFNALAYANTGAARVTEQSSANPESLAQSIAELVRDTSGREKTRAALHGWHSPRAAAQISDAILEAVAARRCVRAAPLNSADIQPRHNAIS